MIWKGPSERTLKFAREVGVIILGVLIALGIGEAADRIRWHFTVADANAAMLKDFARDAGVARERSLFAPCINRRLAETSALLREAERTGRLPAIGEIGRPSIRVMARAAWDTAVGTGVLSHMDGEQSGGWSGWFDNNDAYSRSAEGERMLWGRLSAMSGDARPVSETLLSELALIEADLHSANSLTTAIGRGVEQRARELGLQPEYWLILDREGGTEREVAALVSKRAICQPLIVEGKRYVSPPPAGS